MSPNFLYRAQESRGSAEAYAIADHELAERLAFFLWASVPDEELLQVAESGRLNEPDVLLAQARRMLADERGKRLAKHFAAAWMHFEGFEEYSAPDGERFAEFTPELREDMHREALLFFDDLFRNDQPITNVYDADYTFLNERLARHYGIKGVAGEEFRKVQVPKSRRGGVIGMGAILTKTSKPLRTSPVLRGEFVLSAVLGTPVPPPPDDVPLLSDDEVSKNGLTLAEQLAQHRDNTACYSCHARLDPLGYALENFDPIGRWRETYLSGNPVKVDGVMPNGEKVAGLEGLRQYIADRQDQFVRNFSRTLLGYALGRRVEVIDEPLLQKIVEDLEANDYRFSTMLSGILTSPQFLHRIDPQPESTELSYAD